MNGDMDRTHRDQAAENLCRWAAARAGMIVVAPGIGTMALVTNEIYMIIRNGKVYVIELSHSAAFGFYGVTGGGFCRADPGDAVTHCAYADSCRRFGDLCRRQGCSGLDQSRDAS